MASIGEVDDLVDENVHFAPTVAISAVHLHAERLRLIFRVHLYLLHECLKDDTFELLVKLPRVEDNRRCQEQAVVVIAVSDQKDVFFEELSLALFRLIWDRYVLLGLAHSDTIDNVGVLEGVLLDSWHELHLVVLEHDVVHVPRGLAREVDVNVAQTLVCDLLEGGIAILDNLCLGP